MKDRVVVSSRLPMRIYTAALIFTGIVLGGLGWNIYSSYLDNEVSLKRNIELSEQQNILMHLGEVLSMSSRMAMATQDPIWERRYRSSRPTLDAALKRARALTKNSYSHDAAVQAERARIQLMGMENRAFTYLQEGLAKDATLALFNETYELEEGKYKEGITRLYTPTHLSLHLMRLAGDIIYLDEVLTMSARLAVATRDLHWEDRYRLFEPDLDAAIKGAITLAPDAYSGNAAQTDAANIKLVEMEKRAFTLLRQGRHKEALAILFSEDYEVQKRLYGEGMGRFVERLNEQAKSFLSWEQKKALISAAAVIFVLGLLLFAWLPVLRAFRKWQAVLLESNDDLVSQAQELNELNLVLDQKVAERTSDLERKNETLGIEVLERRKVEEALRMSETRVSGILDVVVEGIVSVDEMGRIILFNKGAEEIFGYSQEEAVGQSLDILIPERFRSIHRSHMTGYIASGEPARRMGDRQEIIGLRKNGQEFPSEASISRLDLSGERILTVVLRDITKRKQAEAELLRSEKKLRDITSALGEGVYVVDERGCLTFMNPEAERLLGWTGAEIMEKNIHDVIHYQKEDGTLVSQDECPVIDLARLASFYRSDDDFYTRKDGTLFPVAYICTSLIKDERVSGFVTVFRDITKLKQAERSLLKAHKELQQSQAQLLQTEKLASIGQLAAGVAHEINNPVGYIKSNLGTLKEYVGEMIQLISWFESVMAAREFDDAEAVARAVQRVRAVAERMNTGILFPDLIQLIEESLEGVERVSQIVQNLKEFSHVDQQERKPFNLNKGLESTLKIVWNELKYKAEVVKELGQIPDILCYPQQLNQVFVNLLVNAAQAIPERGKIWIRTYINNGDVVVEVEDTGRGILPENIGKVFEPFFTTKAVGDGTGLGLSVSYGIVKKHGGRIDVQSIVGKGTTFRILLPSRKDSQ